MARISTHMHFSKLMLENSEDEVDICNFLLGLVSPDIYIDDETNEKYHYLDEDGDIDVKEFYESFNWESLNFKEKSFVLGYYSHLWFDEYYKFNASKLIVHNKNDLSDEELGHAVKNLLTYYDYKVINRFYDEIKQNIIENNDIIEIEKLEQIDIKKSKQLLTDFLSSPIHDQSNTYLINEKDYVELIYSSCDKFLSSIS